MEEEGFLGPLGLTLFTLSLWTAFRSLGFAHEARWLARCAFSGQASDVGWARPLTGFPGEVLRLSIEGIACVKLS